MSSAIRLSVRAIYEGESSGQDVCCGYCLESPPQLRLSQWDSGLVQGARKSRLPLAPERAKRKQPVRPGYSTVRHKGERLRLRKRWRRGFCGKSSKDASAINAVGDASENVFYFFSSQIGIQLID